MKKSIFTFIFILGVFSNLYTFSMENRLEKEKKDKKVEFFKGDACEQDGLENLVNDKLGNVNLKNKNKKVLNKVVEINRDDFVNSKNFVSQLIVSESFLEHEKIKKFIEKVKFVFEDGCDNIELKYVSGEKTEKIILNKENFKSKLDKLFNKFLMASVRLKRGKCRSCISSAPNIVSTVCALGVFSFFTSLSIAGNRDTHAFVADEIFTVFFTIISFFCSHGFTGVSLDCIGSNCSDVVDARVDALLEKEKGELYNIVNGFDQKV